MPEVKNQDMFPMEQCNKCDMDGVLHLTLRGRYIWRCPDCFGTWRTQGSQMDVINAIRGEPDYDTPARGLVVEEKE